MTQNDPYSDITPSDSSKTFREVVEDAEFIRLASPSVSGGDPCVDFDLPLYDFSSGSRTKTGSSFRLSEESANRPVALIFGSYT